MPSLIGAASKAIVNAGGQAFLNEYQRFGKYKITTAYEFTVVEANKYLIQLTHT